MANWRVPPSLKSIFAELDLTWPNRQHGNDGTIGDSRHCPGSSDHCPDANGWIHAIDIEKNGIDPDYVVGKLSNAENVVRYLNWNHFQYHERNDFRPTPLPASDPHTDHIHVSIEHTDYARNFTGPWGIYAPYTATPIDIPPLVTPSQAFWDHSDLVYDLAVEFRGTADTLAGYENLFAQLRG